MPGQPEWMDDVDWANDLAREQARAVRRRAEDEANAPDVASDTPDSTLGLPEPAEHEPGCSCYDCLETQFWAEDAYQTQLDELRESQRVD